MAKKLVEKVFRYNAIFEPCEEGGFVVTVPKLPGLATEGDSFEEAQNRAQDAIKGYLQVLKEAGEEIPETDNHSFTSPIDIKLAKDKFAGI